MIGSHVKITDQTGLVRRFRMYSIDDTVQVNYLDHKCDLYDMTIYIPAATLREHRTIAVRDDWDQFCEDASSFMGYKVSQNDLCAMLKHGPYTVRRCLGLTGVAPTRSQKVIGDVEHFMSKFYAEKFDSFPARLHMVKKRKSSSTSPDQPSAKRSRTSLSPLAHEFIDSYLETYISLSGDYKARDRLFLEILEQAQTRKETLGSENWHIPVIQKRLQNALTAKNRRENEEEFD